MAKSLKNSKYKVIIAVLLSIILAMTAVIAACGGKGKISLDVTEHTMYVADTLRLTATAPEDEEITWSSSDTTVASVRRGTVTALGVGTATISASLNSGDSATCEITVKDRTVTISQTEAEIDLSKGNTLTLTATSSDGGAVTWSSDNAAIASVADGVVTATGEGIGYVNITAQRGAATATCAVHVIDPNRPADWRLLESKKNAEVVGNPGVWYYFADGSNLYTFSKKPWYGGNSVGVTFDKAIKPVDGQSFYFRYQPAAYNEDGENELTVGTEYVMTFTVEVNADVRIRYGQDPSVNADVFTDTPKDIYYVGKITSTESNTPFTLRISSILDESREDLSGVSILLSNIKVWKKTADDKEPDKEQPNPVTPANEYDLTWASSADTVASPNQWFYMVDSEGNGENEVVSATYNNGVVTLELSSTTADKTYQLRYQPWLELGYDTPYTATLTVNVSADVDIMLGRNGNTKNITDIVAGEDYQVEYQGSLSADAPFFVQLKNYTPGQPVTLVVKDVSFEVRTNGNLEARTMADCIKSAGRWFYFADGSADTFTYTEAPWYDENSVGVTFETAPAGGQFFYFRYQPNLTVGNTYTAKFKITISVNAEVRYGQPGVNGDGSKDNSTFKNESIIANTPTEVTFTSTLTNQEPFSVRINSCEGENLNGVTFTLTDISFVEVEGGGESETPAGDSYDLTAATNSEVVQNPGRWYYTATDETKLASAPEYDNGTITLSLTAGANSSDNYQLRYQPDFGGGVQAGTQYTVTFTVTVSASSFIIVGCGNEGAGMSNFPDGASSANDVRFQEGEEATFTYTVTAVDQMPFFIQIKGFSSELPITLTVSNITFAPVTE